MFKNSVFLKSVDTEMWFYAACVRAIKTMAQVAGAMLVVGAFNETAWGLLLQTALTSGIASMLMSIAGLPEVEAKEK